VFFPDRVSKLRALCTKCTVLYSDKITENKADSSVYGLSTVMYSCKARMEQNELPAKVTVFSDRPKDAERAK